MRRIDERDMAIGPADIVAFMNVRNEALRLPQVLDYHRGLGVDRFFVVDNGSTDGSLEVLLGAWDAHVFATDESYAASNYGLDWINPLLAQHAVGHWQLTIDADELLVYPGCEKVDLHGLTETLDAAGDEAVATFLLDMYSDKPIAETAYSPGLSLIEACPFFDGNSYDVASLDATHPVPTLGGPRTRVFWARSRSERPPPYLAKLPLARWREARAYGASTHVLPGASVSEMTGALLHFKFLDDFPARAAEEAQRGEHWQVGAQYNVYDSLLKEEPGLSLFYEGSVRYRDSGQLVEMGLIRE
ncbi:MAG: glycosyltransferase family 2 protein [Candidatus Limnocylindrales bacterium]